MTPDARPTESFTAELQHERTSLAWERTAIALVVAGAVLARVGAERRLWVVAGAGVAQAVFGAGVLVWAGVRYEDLHGPLRRGDDIVHPVATRLVGLVAVTACAVGLLVAIAAALSG